MRVIANAFSETSFDIVVPAAIVDPDLTFTGAINCTSDPTKTLSPIVVRVYLRHRNYR